MTDERFERADEFSRGGQVLGADGRVITVSGLRLGTRRGASAYNLSVEGIHAYHVGQAGILVHNTFPNPYGRLGSPAHRAEVQNIADEITASGLTPKFADHVPTPGGFKQSRSVDVAALDQAGIPVACYQVGRQTMGGLRVMRESRAIWDLWSESSGISIIFRAYN